MPGSVYVYLLGGCLCASVGQILFKFGATGREGIWLFVNPWVSVGLLFYGVGTLLWIYSLSKANLTFVYPFTTLTFILVYGYGVFVLREPASVKALAGAIMVLIGLFLVSTG